MSAHLQLVQGFQSRTLDKTHWTHQAHQVAAIWYLVNYEADDALCRIRSGIIAYNLASGGENTGQNGYHETITIFWWRLIDLFIEKHRGLSFDELCTLFLQSAYCDRSAPLSFYSKERLLSSTARSRYLEPNLAEIKL